MRFGMDYLLGAYYGAEILKTHPAGWAAGFFAGYYRNRSGKIEDAEKAMPIIKKLLQTGRCPQLRVHILWDDAHSFSDADIPLVRKVAKEYEALAQEFPSVKIEISPFCEHSLKNPDKYLDIVKEEAPSCTPVNSVWQGAESAKYKNEVHGYHHAPKKGAYNYSFDGTSCVDADVEKLKKAHSRSDCFYFWIPQMNRKLKDTDPTPRPERKVKPTVQQLESVIYLSNPRGRCKLPKNTLWKSHGDQHSYPPAPRESKPVLLLPGKASKVELVLRGLLGRGKVVGVLKPSGTFSDGRQIWRLDEFGYQLMQKVKNKNLRLRVDGKNVGLINAAFRFGGFR